MSFKQFDSGLFHPDTYLKATISYPPLIGDLSRRSRVATRDRQCLRGESRDPLTSHSRRIWSTVQSFDSYLSSHARVWDQASSDQSRLNLPRGNGMLIDAEEPPHWNRLWARSIFESFPFSPDVRYQPQDILLTVMAMIPVPSGFSRGTRSTETKTSSRLHHFPASPTPFSLDHAFSRLRPRASVQPQPSWQSTNRPMAVRLPGLPQETTSFLQTVPSPQKIKERISASVPGLWISHRSDTGWSGLGGY